MWNTPSSDPACPPLKVFAAFDAKSRPFEINLEIARDADINEKPFLLDINIDRISCVASLVPKVLILPTVELLSKPRHFLKKPVAYLHNKTRFKPVKMLLPHGVFHKATV
jgi:hypothetical protein